MVKTTKGMASAVCAVTKPKVVPVRRRRSNTRNMAIANAMLGTITGPTTSNSNAGFSGKRPRTSATETRVPIGGGRQRGEHGDLHAEQGRADPVGILEVGLHTSAA